MSLERAARGSAPTLEEVAARAGVSRSTASRVINGSAHVSTSVVQAVNDAIARLNYVPNRAARSLANRQTGAIALVVPDDASRFFGEPYFAAVIGGISAALASTDYVLNLLFTSSTSPTAKTMRYLTGGNVDGALVISHHRSDHFLAGLDDSLPVVFNGRPLNIEESHAYVVDVDNERAARQGVRYLIDRGRTRIATITGPDDMTGGFDRAQGWRAELESAGLPAMRIADGDFTRGGGMRAMSDLLVRHPDLDAVFAASDVMAAGAVSVLLDQRRSVPGDVAVIGFDDSPAALDSTVPLTTVAQPSVEMGQRMATMLLELLRGGVVERRSIMPTRVVVRESA